MGCFVFQSKSNRGLIEVCGSGLDISSWAITSLAEFFAFDQHNPQRVFMTSFTGLQKPATSVSVTYRRRGWVAVYINCSPEHY